MKWITRESLPRFGRLLAMLLAAAPLLVLVYLVKRYYVDVPFWDQWDFVPILAKFYQGTLGLQDLWLQHNEHRLIFPQIIFLFLARISGWNIGYELAANILLALLILLVLVYQIRATTRALGISLLWITPILSLIVFSLSQGENWLWGYTLQIFLNILAVTAGLVCLSRSANPWAFVAAIALGIVAIYSFANGVTYWIIGVAVLLTIDLKSKRTARLACWGVVAGLTILSYLYDYRTPGNHPSLLLVLQEPLQYIEYVLIYLGMPVTFNSVGCQLDGRACQQPGIIAAALSLSGLIAFTCLTWFLLRRIGVQKLAPYLGLALYAVSSALITALGRVGFGPGQAMASRYVSISSLFWVALLVFLGLTLRLLTANHPFRYMGSGFVMVIVLLVSFNSYQWRNYFISRFELLNPVRAELLLLRDDELLKRISYSPDYVRSRIPVLQQYHLAVFREPGVSGGSQLGANP